MVEVGHLPYNVFEKQEVPRERKGRDQPTGGVSTEEARALYRFQMTGCYTVAMGASDDADNKNGWPVIQGTLDTFIRGGMAALRNR